MSTEIPYRIEHNPAYASLVLDVPANETVSCDDIPAPVQVSAEDNCDEDVEVTFAEVSGEGCPYTITRTWTATDDCGNTDVQSQVLTVIDEENPSIVSVPAGFEIECDEVIPLVDAVFDDNCDDNLDVVYNESTEDSIWVVVPP